MEGKRKKALEIPHDDPVMRDHCWKTETETFPSEVGVEVHARVIFNRDGAGGVGNFKVLTRPMKG